MKLPDTAVNIWLFGSEARGVSDSGSDIDVLLVAKEDCSSCVRNWMAKRIGISERERIDISLYSVEGIASLVGQGSLFTWHLKREGVPLFDRYQYLSELLSSMLPYSRHIDDLQTLIDVAADVVLSAKSNQAGSIFNSGVLGTVIRNSSIILLDHLGMPDYSPWAPLVLADAREELAPPITEEEYRYLVLCRRMGERGIGTVSSRGNDWLLRTSKLSIDWQWRCKHYISGGAK